MSESKSELIEYYKNHLAIAKEAGDRASEGRAYGNLGNAYESLGQFKEAIEYHKKSLSVAKEVGDRAGEGRAYRNLGDVYDSLGQFKEAFEYYKKDMSIAREVGDRAGEGRDYGNLGTAYHSLGQFQYAIAYYNKHLSIAKGVDDRAGEGRTYGNLGSAYCSLGQFQEAIEYHNKHLSIAKEMGDRAGEGTAYGNLVRAIEYYKKDLVIAIEVGSRYGEGRACGNLGNAYHSLGQFQEAIEYHKKDLSITKEVGDRAGEGMASGNLGIAYDSLGQFEDAIECHSNRLYISKEVGDRAGEARANCNLGNTYLRLGKFQDAIEHYKKDLSIAKEVGDRAGEGRACGNIGSAYHSLGQFQEAIEYYKKDLSISKEVFNGDGEARAYGNLGNAYNSLGQFQEASESYQSSIKLFDMIRASLQHEEVWKISFRDLFRATYTSLWSTLLKLQDIDEALCAAERGRAQALVDDLKMQYGFTVMSSVSLEPKETVSYISSGLTTQTVFVGLEHNKMSFWVISIGNSNRIQFRQREIGGAQEDGVATLVETTLEQIGAGVGVRCENRSMDKLRDDSPSNEGGDEEGAGSTQCTMESLRPLYDAIIGPIEDLCQGDELIMVPDGPLCLAPLAALSECIRIRTVPSLTSLKLIIDSPEDYQIKSGALLVGDPCLQKVTKKSGKPMYSQLPNAKKEVEMIGEILKIPALTGTEATKRNVLQRITSVALVRIAAHGRKETGEIALAPNPGWENHLRRSRSKIKIPNEEDYILKIADVQAVCLRARLVVLSCCHSGRGKVKSEGVVGIARAFLAAGARSVLVSLWAIDDEATMEFMKGFYQHLTNGKSASVALQQAMKSLRDSEKFCDAKYWAPFLLIGDDVTLEHKEKESEKCEWNLL